MGQQDQDIENRLKCLNGRELTELLDFILPNRAKGEGDDNTVHSLAPTSPIWPH